MEKEFVPYKIVLKLKALGFNEPCFVYIYTGDTVNNIDHVIETKPSLAKNHNLDSLCISKPTFSQAFRWFREKYGLFHSITEYNKDGSLIIEISKDRVEIFRKMTNFDFTEYREAELACLEKLIEIVEERNK